MGIGSSQPKEWDQKRTRNAAISAVLVVAAPVALANYWGADTSTLIGIGAGAAILPVMGYVKRMELQQGFMGNSSLQLQITAASLAASGGYYYYKTGSVGGAIAIAATVPAAGVGSMFLTEALIK